MSETPSASKDVYFLPDIVKRIRRPEKCEICRHKAIGYHYGVASCNGCKAFFRRTIITGRRYTCKLENNCLSGNDPVEASARNGWICGACRFARCVQLKMNPKSINKELITQKGKLLMEEIMLNVGSNQLKTAEDELSTMICKLKQAEYHLEKLHSAIFPKNFEDGRNLEVILKERPIFDSSKINLCFSKDQLFPDHASMCHNGVLSTIEFAKLLDFFPKISLSSKKKLIMNGAFSASSMASSYYSVRKFNSDIIRRQDGTIAGKPMRNYNGIWMDHREILQKTLHAYLTNRLDQIEYMFLKAIVLCNPGVSDLPEEDRKVIEEHRFHYARNLLQYCLKQHGQLHGPDRFGAILSVIPIMESQNKGLKSFGFVLRYFYPNATTIVSPLYDELCEED